MSRKGKSTGQCSTSQIKGTTRKAAGSSRDKKMEDLRAAFELFDRNKNGCIEAEELGIVMESLGYKASSSELRDMINEADIDGNSMIDFNEFVRLMETKGTSGCQNEEEELKEAFKVFDCDGNGYISRDELSKVMKNIGEDLTEQDLSEMIKEADKNGDGRIDLSEFLEIVSHK